LLSKTDAELLRLVAAQCISVELFDHLRNKWAEYVEYLKKKHPAHDGKPWTFTCGHHQDIDSLLVRIKVDRDRAEQRRQEGC
jgi:hypothetical protein